MDQVNNWGDNVKNILNTALAVEEEEEEWSLKHLF